MNKVNSLIIALFAGIISCTAQRTENRPVSAYSHVEVDGNVSVYYTESDTLDLRVEGSEKDLSKLFTEVEKGILHINNKNSNSELKVYLKNNKLNSVLMSGATSFNSTGTVHAESFSISLSGASELRLAVETKVIDCIQSGASQAVLKGKTDNLKAELVGAATLKAYNLITANADVVTTGAATAKVFVTEKVKANANGASTIKIKGDAKEVVGENSPAASISRINSQSSTNEKKDGDTTTYRWKNRKIVVIEDNDNICIEQERNGNRKRFKHWRGFSAGVNGYANAKNGLNMVQKYKYMDLDYSKSYNFQLNLIERQFNIVKNYFKVVTGFGIDYHQYELSNKTNLNADSTFTWGLVDSTNTYTYAKNKLRATYLQVPLLLEFNTSNNSRKSFHMAVGVIGQYLVASRTKQLLEKDKYEITKVRTDNYNLSPFSAKAHVNFGYRNWTVFGEYSLAPLFQRGKGPELYPFSVGLRLVAFT